MFSLTLPDYSILTDLGSALPKMDLISCVISIIFVRFCLKESNYDSVTTTAVSELNSFHRRGIREFFGIRSARPLMATSVLKTKLFFPLSLDEKGTTSGAKASANHLAPPHHHHHPIRLLNDLHSLLRPTKLGLWRADSLTYILTGFGTSSSRPAVKNWPSFVSLF